MSDKAVILLSGGLDSATCLAVAKSLHLEVYALSFDYGQRHRCELEAARRVAASMGVKEHRVCRLDLAQWGGSALTNPALAIPRAEDSHDIPITYVPARNLVFLSIAGAWAEAIGAREIFIGVNSVDYSGYPDCRARFIAAFAEALRQGTRAVDEHWQWRVSTPLQDLSKAEIIRLGTGLGVNYRLTVSCYAADAEGRACGVCASCALRKEGFAAAGVPDPTVYRK